MCSKCQPEPEAADIGNGQNPELLTGSITGAVDDGTGFFSGFQFSGAIQQA
jgi:hypothetical protein